MLKDASFGQYYPAKSFVHSMDARVKLFLTVCLLVGIFFASSYFAYAAVALFLALAIALSRVRLGALLRSIRPILFLIVFSAVLNLLFHGGGEVILAFWIIKITNQAVAFAVMMVLRLVMLVTGTCLLTLTTTPVALTDAIESLLKPLKLIKFPVHELALIMSIALRMIPTLMEETDRIISAQKARGADFESGNIFRRAKALLPVLIPLLISAFRRADELADAMDSRCYFGAKGRTKMKRMKMTWRDPLALLFAFGVIAFIFVDKYLLMLSFV